MQLFRRKTKMKEIKLSINKIKNHEQKEPKKRTCIASSIEAVLKLLGKINQYEHPLQLELFPVLEEKRKKKGEKTLNGSDFSRKYYGVSFESKFFPPIRNGNFPIDKLFKKIDSELDKEKYVIISLREDSHFHNWIIYGKNENGDFLAVNPGTKNEITITDVKKRVQDMEGTDIMIYNVIPSNEELLVEYQAAQDSAQHHDNLVWTTSGLIWGSSLVLLGFVLNKLSNPPCKCFIIALCIISIMMYVAVWIFACQFASIKKQKYNRCKEIEKEINLKQHRTLKYRGWIQRAIYGIIMLAFIVFWIVILLKVLLY